MKAGFYWDTSENIQSSSGSDSRKPGHLQLRLGSQRHRQRGGRFPARHAGNYPQQNRIPTNDIKIPSVVALRAGLLQGQSQLTLNYGLRFDHVGQWYGPPNGMAVWNPGTYNNSALRPPVRTRVLL